MKKIVVNDTNVFIDLFNVGLLERFFSLPWEVHTTEFVMLELTREGQHDSVSQYKDNGLLHIPVFDEPVMYEIIKLYQQQKDKTNVSLTDCTVWYYAKQNNYTLLTGDRKLRNASLIDGVEVHGILYVIDQLVEEGILAKRIAISKLKQLEKSNPRLPQDEIEKHLKLWKKEIKQEGGCLCRYNTSWVKKSSHYWQIT